MTDGPYKTATHVPVTSEIIGDFAHAIEAMRHQLRAAHRQVFTPWEFPDPNPMPRIDLFPRLARLTDTLAEGRQRVSAAVDVLRCGPQEDDQ